MLKVYTILQTYWKPKGTPRHTIYHYSMVKFTKDKDNIEKYDSLVITPYIIQMKVTYKIKYHLNKINGINSHVILQEICVGGTQNQVGTGRAQRTVLPILTGVSYLKTVMVDVKQPNRLYNHSYLY